MLRVAFLALLLVGCPLSHGDYPGTACEKDSDCFIGQGEICNQDSHQCQVMIDAGPTPDRPPIPDHPPEDGADFMDGMSDGGSP